jgi:hypothetical protein
MSLGGALTPILGTNPLGYAVPRPGKLPVFSDQAKRCAKTDGPIADELRLDGGVGQHVEGKSAPARSSASVRSWTCSSRATVIIKELPTAVSIR